MLGIVSMAGNALKAFGNTHPAVKWGVIVLAFLLAAEFVGKEGISTLRDTLLIRPTVDQQNATTVAAKMEAYRQCVTQLPQWPRTGDNVVDWNAGLFDPEGKCDKYAADPQLLVEKRQARIDQVKRAAARCGADETYMLGACAKKTKD